jgi:hypothetical protein
MEASSPCYICKVHDSISQSHKDISLYERRPGIGLISCAASSKKKIVRQIVDQQSGEKEPLDASVSGLGGQHHHALPRHGRFLPLAAAAAALLLLAASRPPRSSARPSQCHSRTRALCPSSLRRSPPLLCRERLHAQLKWFRRSAAVGRIPRPNSSRLPRSSTTSDASSRRSRPRSRG